MEVHPLSILAFVFGIIILMACFSLGLKYILPAFGSTDLIFANNPIAYNIAQTGNYLANNEYAFSLTTWNLAIIIISIFALSIYAYAQWREEDRQTKAVMGIVNLILIFLVPIIWLALNIAISGVFTSSIMQSAGLGNLVAYFTSTYFVVIVEFFLILGTIGDFRPSAPELAGIHYAEGNIRDNSNTR
jgi:tellurite resistance protein TehA-like permease